MQCLTCKREMTSKRSTKRFCSNKCKLAYHHKSLSVSKTVPVSVSNDTITVVDTVKIDTLIDTLKFPKDMPIAKRIEKYKELNPDYTFVPNWIINGHTSREDAINHVLSYVRGKVTTGLSG